MPCSVPVSVGIKPAIAPFIISMLLGFTSMGFSQTPGSVLFDSNQLEPTDLRVGFAVSMSLNPYSQRSVDQFWNHAETDFRSSVLTSVLITSFGNIEHSMRTLSEFAIYDGPIDSLVVVDSVGVRSFTILRLGLPEAGPAIEPRPLAESHSAPESHPAPETRPAPETHPASETRLLADSASIYTSATDSDPIAQAQNDSGTEVEPDSQSAAQATGPGYLLNPEPEGDILRLNELIVKAESDRLDSLATSLPEQDIRRLLPTETELQRQQRIGSILVDSLHRHMSYTLPCGTTPSGEIGYEPIAHNQCWYVRGQAIYSRYDPQRSYILARQDALSRLSMYLGNRVRSFVMVLDERSISTDYQVSSFLFTDITLSRLLITESYVDVILAVPVSSITPIN